MAREWLDRPTDVHIKLPLRVFDPMACSRMCCAQLQAVLLLLPKSDEDNHTERHREIETDIDTYKDTDTQDQLIPTEVLWTPV